MCTDDNGHGRNLIIDLSLSSCSCSRCFSVGLQAMSSVRLFLRLFHRRGSNGSDARRFLQTSQCTTHKNVPLKYTENSIISYPITSSELLSSNAFLHHRNLHTSFPLSQVPQQESDELSASENGNNNNNESSTSTASKAKEEKISTESSNDVDESTAASSTDALTPVVPGMPTVRRGVQVAPVGVTLSIHGLIKEMTERIKKRLFQEAIDIYREWLQCIDPITGQPNKPLVTPCNIALLAEGLKGAPVDILMKRVEEMRRLGLSPNTDTFYVLFNAAADSKDFGAFDRLFSL